jgi:hypothetical protein
MGKIDKDSFDAGYDYAVSERNRYQEIGLDLQRGKEFRTNIIQL